MHSFEDLRGAAFLVIATAVAGSGVACGGRAELHATDSTINDAGKGVESADGATSDFPCTPLEHWSNLPDCSYVDACYALGGRHYECLRASNCTFSFEAPVPDMPYLILHACGKAFDQGTSGEPGSWTLSTDRSSFQLQGELCKAWNGSNHFQLVLQSMHPCIL